MNIIHIYIAKIILHYDSKTIARILAVIVNCEMCIVNCNIYTLINNEADFISKVISM